MCQGWKSTLAKPRVDEAIMGYQQACEFVPNEILDKVKPLFIGELVGLISAWFDKAQQRYYDVQDWYSSNIDIFGIISVLQKRLSDTWICLNLSY